MGNQINLELQADGTLAIPRNRMRNESGTSESGANNCQNGSTIATASSTAINTINTIANTTRKLFHRADIIECNLYDPWLMPVSCKILTERCSLTVWPPSRSSSNANNYHHHRYGLVPPNFYVMTGYDRCMRRDLKWCNIKLIRVNQDRISLYFPLQLEGQIDLIFPTGSALRRFIRAIRHLDLYRLVRDEDLIPYIGGARHRWFTQADQMLRALNRPVHYLLNTQMVHENEKMNNFVLRQVTREKIERFQRQIKQMIYAMNYQPLEPITLQQVLDRFARFVPPNVMPKRKVIRTIDDLLRRDEDCDDDDDDREDLDNQVDDDNGNNSATPAV